jgi:hypothetical protein
LPELAILFWPFVHPMKELVISGLFTGVASKWTKHGCNSVEIDYIVDIDNNHEDPQLCATLAFDIYKHLRVAEVIDSFTCHIPSPV